MPEDTNLLAKIYQGIKDRDVLILQRHLWDYKESYIREQRAREIIQLASETLYEFDR